MGVTVTIESSEHTHLAADWWEFTNRQTLLVVGADGKPIAEYAPGMWLAAAHTTPGIRQAA